MLDFFKTVALSVGFICVGIAVAVVVFFALVARDAGNDGAAAGCIGAGVTLGLLSLAVGCFYVSFYA